MCVCVLLKKPLITQVKAGDSKTIVEEQGQNRGGSWVAAADEVGVDLPFCVSECEGRGGWACSVDDGGGFGLEAVDAGRGDCVSDVEEVG